MRQEDYGGNKEWKGGEGETREVREGEGERQTGKRLQVKIKQKKPRWNSCKLFSSTRRLPPVTGTVKQAPLVMKGKIFYSDLLI